MSKKKEPFKITGPGVYSTRLKVLVEIIGRPFRHLAPPFDPSKSNEPWIGVRMGQTEPGIVEVSAWNDDGIEGKPINDVIRIGDLIRREPSFNTSDEIRAAGDRELRLRHEKRLMTEPHLRRAVLNALELSASYEENNLNGFSKSKPFSELTSGTGSRKLNLTWQGYFIRTALEQLDDNYAFALGQDAEGDRAMTLTELPGKKGGLPKMANAEDVAIYVADRLGIPLKNKPWAIPTIKLPVKKSGFVKARLQGATAKQAQAAVDADDKIPAKLKKPAKPPTVKVVDGGYYRDGKGKIHGPMRKLKKPENIGVEFPGFPWVGKLRSASGKPISRKGSGEFFNYLGKQLFHEDKGVDPRNNLIERVTYFGDKYEAPGTEGVDSVS